MKPKNPDLAMPDGLCECGKRAWETIVGVLIKKRATFTGGCKAFYSPAAWKARGEKYGTDSVLVVVHDGGDVAPFFNYDYEQYPHIETMRKALEKVGLWAEAETCWYTAIYETGQ